MRMNWKQAAVGLIFTAAIGGAAIPAAASAAPTRTQAASVSFDEFVGFGEGRGPGAALIQARRAARQQAIAAGYNPSTQCTTTFEDAEPPSSPGNPSGLWIGESDLVCQR